MAKFRLSNGQVVTLSDELSIEEATDTIDAIERGGKMDVKLKNGSIIKLPDDATNQEIAEIIRNNYPEEFADDTKEHSFIDDGINFIKTNPEFDAAIIVTISTITLIFFMRKKIYNLFIKCKEKVFAINVQMLILLVLCFIAFEIFKIERKITAIPTQNEIAALSKSSIAQRKKMFGDIPFVYVHGGNINADVDNTVDVNVQNTVDVEINR